MKKNIDKYIDKEGIKKKIIESGIKARRNKRKKTQDK